VRRTRAILGESLHHRQEIAQLVGIVAESVHDLGRDIARGAA